MKTTGESNVLRRKGLVVVGLWLLTMIMGYWALGNFVQETVEGIDSTQIPKWPLVIFAVVALASIILSVRWAKNLKRVDETQNQVPASGRRKFLTGSAAVTGGVLGVAGATVARVSEWSTVTLPAVGTQTEQTAPNPKSAWIDARIQQYRPLGNTGLSVSDISAGSTRLHQNANPVGFLNALLDRGVNYIDASPDYAPQSEKIIREAITGRDRSKLVIATKFCTAHGHVRHGSSVQHYMQAMESALTRMGTEYVDVAHIHSCDTVERLMDENLHEAFDRLKSQGKVHHLGVSTHTPNLAEVANTAIDSGRFDVMMLAYHHGAWPTQQQNHC